MNRLFKLSVLMLTLTSGSSYALNPIDGVYAGFFLGGTYSPGVNATVINPITGLSLNTSIGTSFFGNAGGQIGYRIENFRIEAEGLYNYTPFDKLTLGAVTIRKTKHTTGYSLKGGISTAAFLVNGYYDFFTRGSSSDIVPYVGLGAGYGYFSSNLKFYLNDIYIANSKLTNTDTAPVGQGIVGFNYFLDDYTTIGLDYRYITSTKIGFTNHRVQINAINLVFSGSF